MNRSVLPSFILRWDCYALLVSLTVLFGLWTTWPRAVTIGDELYYLGHAHALAHARLIPTCADPYPIPHCNEAAPIKYPMSWPLLLAIAMRGGLRLAMNANVVIHLILGAIFGLFLKRRRVPIGYAFLVLLHPSFYIYSLTSLASLVSPLFLLLAIWSLQEGRIMWTAAILGVAATVHLGALLYGIVFVAYILSQTWNRVWKWQHFFSFLFFYALVASFVPAGYYLTQSSILPHIYLASYGESFPFSLSYAPHNLIFYLTALGLVYPLTFLGFLYNRLLERLIIIVLFSTHCAYFFTDHGRTFGESIVLGQRLLLPLVTLLLLGYAEALEHLRQRLGTVVPGMFFLVIIAAVLFVGARAGRYQNSIAQSAAAIDAQLPVGSVLRYDPEAAKIMPLLSHPRWFDMTPPDAIPRQNAGIYYLVARVPLSYRTNQVLPPRAINGTLVVETPTCALYRLADQSPISYATNSNTPL